jgi:hypothetical protein
LFSSIPNVDIKATGAGGNNNTPKGTSVGAIVGGVIGGLALLLVITSVIFFRRRRMQQASKIPDVDNTAHSVLRPFRAQAIQVSLNDHCQNEILMDVGVLHFHISNFQPSSEPQYPMQSVNQPASPLVPLASKGRELLQQNEPHHRHHSERDILIPANQTVVSGSGRGEVSRAEVDDLRREMEAIRNIAQPPPVYQ